MAVNSNQRNGDAPPRWGFLLIALLIFILAAVILVLLWQVPRIVPPLAAPTVETTPTATTRPRSTPTSLPAIHGPTSTPAVTQPTITRLRAEVDDGAGMVTFHLAADVAPDRQIQDAFLWYNTEAGHRLRRVDGPLPPGAPISYQVDATREGLTTTLTAGEPWHGMLDYWWLVRDTSGDMVRGGGTVALGPALQALASPLAPQPPPLDFPWAESSSPHFRFFYMSGSAAERDIGQLTSLAEAALVRISGVLEVEFDGQMDIYLVPRLFWQGGAAYGNKEQLLSYLDRNYAAVETWTYFTHEGTHALAQDLLQPKEDGGAPDGVLVEGLAVWASGGHYRLEPLDAWAATVAASEDYIPLADLRAGPFYEFQHEISYLEAASFIKFLIERYGLERFKELYGLASGDPERDERLVERLYAQSYADLEAAWLERLSSLQPTGGEAKAWHLTRRSFDLMRRYETELDPNARILPSTTPPDWELDLLEAFTHRLDAPVNVVLETALISAQDRLQGGDLEGAGALLDDVEAALDAGATEDMSTWPSLAARQAIVDLLRAQDRAILRADASAYLTTVDRASTQAGVSAVEQSLRPPFTSYGQEPVRLEVDSDGRSARGVVLLHARVIEPGRGGEGQANQTPEQPFAQDGQLFALTFAKVGGLWVVTSREPVESRLELPPSAPESSLKPQGPGLAQVPTMLDWASCHPTDVRQPVREARSWTNENASSQPCTASPLTALL